MHKPKTASKPIAPPSNILVLGESFIGCFDRCKQAVTGANGWPEKPGS